MKIASARDVLTALALRAEYFHDRGCRISDHALDTVPFEENCEEAAQAAFDKVMRGGKPTETETDAYRTYIMIGLGDIYSKLGWAQQYHMNAQRNNNTPIYKK